MLNKTVKENVCIGFEFWLKNVDPYFHYCRLDSSIYGTENFLLHLLLPRSVPAIGSLCFQDEWTA